MVLSTGEIDFVASDHSPSRPDMKTGNDFFKIWGGVAGVQSTLPALLTLEAPRLPLPSVAKYTAGNIAKRFCARAKGSIDIDNDADFTVVDASAEYELTRDMLLDRHKLSPYVGRTFRGRVRRTIVRGTTVFLHGKIVSPPVGRLVKPA
jgi:allantoinase